jgi:hypothetical protein
MKKYNHFVENEIFDNGQKTFGKFLIQMTIVAVIAFIIIYFFY